MHLMGERQSTGELPAAAAMLSLVELYEMANCWRCRYLFRRRRSWLSDSREREGLFIKLDMARSVEAICLEVETEICALSV